MLAQLQLVFDVIMTVPQEVTRANYYLTIVKDAYLQKKISHLEAKAHAASDCFLNHCDEFGQHVKAHQDALEAIEKGISVKFPDEEEFEVIEVAHNEIVENPTKTIMHAPQRLRGDASLWLAKGPLP